MSEWQLVSLAELARQEAQTLWVSVSYCAGSEWFLRMYGPKPITRYVYQTREEAYKAKACIDRLACGGGCLAWHVVERALPKERHTRALRIFTVERKHYARYGAMIPDTFLLPQERKARQKEADQATQDARRQRRAGHVYLLHAVGSNRVKIGRSVAKDVRFDHLKAASPYPLVLLRAIPTAEMATLERMLHSRYAQYRQHGEWFDLPPDVLAILLQEEFD